MQRHLNQIYLSKYRIKGEKKSPSDLTQRHVSQTCVGVNIVSDKKHSHHKYTRMGYPHSLEWLKNEIPFLWQLKGNALLAHL